jgi:predicted Zn-dependent protease
MQFEPLGKGCDAVEKQRVMSINPSSVYFTLSIGESHIGEAIERMTDRKARKLKDKAAAYIEKRKFEKALEIYNTLLRQTPGDPGLLLKVGEANRRMGQSRAAIEAYAHAVERYAADGMLLKGIARCGTICRGRHAAQGDSCLQAHSRD